MNNVLASYQIENIIFDLGNVIIRLNIEGTTNAFKDIYGSNYDLKMEDLDRRDVFNQYEKGEISSGTFFNELGRDTKVSKNQLKSAWNAMLLDIPESRYPLMLKSKKRFRTFCLSNTNETHIDFIHEDLKRKKGIPNLNSYFEKVYLSHEMGMRKPDTEIFQKVVDDNRLNPKKTLFIDDTAGHIDGAKKIGLRTLHLTNFDDLEQLIGS